MGQLLSSASLVFAPRPFEVLQASTPPTVSYFKSLSTESQKKDGLYISSFSRNQVVDQRSTLGQLLILRVLIDDSRTTIKNEKLSLNVERALKDGYTIIHKGCLCWTPIPVASQYTANQDAAYRSRSYLYLCALGPVFEERLQDGPHASMAC
jgi:hypothetical protein